MEETIEIGKISSRGQVSIPQTIRKALDLKEGEKVIFVLEGNVLTIKKISDISFSDITNPLKEAVKKAELKESDVQDIVHRARKKWKLFG